MEYLLRSDFFATSKCLSWVILEAEKIPIPGTCCSHTEGHAGCQLSFPAGWLSLEDTWVWRHTAHTFCSIQDTLEHCLLGQNTEHNNPGLWQEKSTKMEECSFCGLCHSDWSIQHQSGNKQHQTWNPQCSLVITSPLPVFTSDYHQPPAETPKLMPSPGNITDASGESSVLLLKVLRNTEIQKKRTMSA
jgi:hypothetical protein